MKKIIFLHHVAGYMMIDIANAFAKKYEDCLLLTGELRKRRKDLSENVKIYKLVKYNPKSNFSRLITWVAGFFQAIWVVWTRGKNADLFITTNPPLGVFLPFFCKNNFSLLIYDIYPDVITQYNILDKKSFIIRLWEKTNKKIFNRAQNVFTIGEGMKELISKYIEPERIKIVTCWADNEFIKPIAKSDNQFIQKYGLQNKFLVMYSGNLGFTHDVEVMVDLAEHINNESVFFIIIGEGDKQKLLDERISGSSKNNIMLLPWQDISMYPHSLSAADLSVVTLGRGASLISVPSKLYDIMAVGAPLLAIAEEKSEMARLIDKYEFGRHYSADKIEEMVEYIEELAQNSALLPRYKSNSLLAAKNFTPANAYKFTANL